MKLKRLLPLPVMLIMAVFLACNKTDTTAPVTEQASMAYTTYDELIASLLKRGYVQKDSLNLIERNLFKGPKFPQSVISSNNATRLFFVKGTEYCYELAKKSSGTWSLPDSLTAVHGMALYKKGSLEVPVAVAETTLLGTPTMRTRFYNPPPQPPPMYVIGYQ